MSGSDGPRPDRDASGPHPTWDRVHEAFHELLALAPAERGARLAALAASDAALEGEVRSLLLAHESAGGFLEDPPALESAAAAPGDRLGPWRIVEEIGRGGMGQVFRAERADGDYRMQVALKMVDPGMRSAGILARFRAERRILARLDHPNIARMIDAGTAPDGSPYLVMEYVEGQPLLAYCDDHALGVDARLALFLGVCDAVQFAHQQLVIHRDIKSDNIRVTPEGSPRLLDFGIAKLVAPDAEGGDATLTVPMQRMLTLDYASPEQVRGDAVGVASDVYSLGVVLYELLTGTRPLRFRTRAPEEILRVMSGPEPVAPSTAVAGAPGDARGEPAARLRRRLSGDLDVIALKALERDPARRYGSVAGLAEDVRRHLDGRPVLARAPSAAYRASRYVRRHRTAVVGTALVLCALLAGLAATAWQAGVAGRERDRADRRFQDVRELAHAVLFDLHDAITELPGSTPARETLVRHALRYLDRLHREAGADPVLQRELAGAYVRIGDVQGRPMFANLGHPADALESYRRALALLAEVARAWPESVSVAREQVIVSQRLGDVLRITGQPDSARARARATKVLILGLLGRDPSPAGLRQDLGVTCDRLSDMALAAGDTAEALAELREGAAAIATWAEADPQGRGPRRAMLIGHLKLAQLYTVTRQLDSAFATLRRADPIVRSAVEDQPGEVGPLRDLSIHQGLLGLALASAGRLDSALAVYEEAMTISERLAARDPANALAREDLAAGELELGTMLRDGGRDAAAADRFGRAADRFAALRAADTSNTEHRWQLVLACREAGDACLRMAARTAPTPGAGAWRERARRWFQRGFPHLRALAARGALPEGERDAPATLTRRLADLGVPVEDDGQAESAGGSASSR